jgi:hypothetical protein
MSESLPATEESKFSDFSYLINNNFYDFRVFLGSLDGRLKLLSPSSIKVLNIEDSIDNPYHSGYIIIDNRYDNIESSFDATVDPANPIYYNLGTTLNPAAQDKSGPYLFAGDSRDILVVSIMPKLATQNTNTSDETVKQFFLLSFNFAIYDTEEIDDGSMDGKLKKLYFWDLDYEILKEKNSYFSTAKYLNVKDKKEIQNLSNSDRRITTGSALSAALAEGLEDINNTSPQFVNFDQGSTTIFFSAPGEYKCIDTVNYLLERHVSSATSNYSPCILQLERYPKKYSLRSFYTVFNNAIDFSNGSMSPGIEYLETFKVAGYTNKETGKLPIFNVVFTPPYAPFFQAEGNLDSYSFDTIAGMYSQTQINTKNVHSYNYTGKEFNIETFRNSVDELDPVLKKFYINPFIGAASKGTPTFQFGNLRKTNKNTSNEFSVIELDTNQRLALGLAENLKNYVYLNNFVSFKVQGATHRQSGKFIGINRDTDKQPTLFDKRFLGVYFVVKVNHIFEDAKYTNELVCVKTYIPQDIFLNKNML